MKLSEEEMDDIDRTRIEVRFRKGDIICKQNTAATHLIYLVEGLAKVFIEGNQNNNVIIQIIPAGNFIGLQSVFNDSVFSDNLLNYSVTAIEDSLACFIDASTFRKVTSNNNALCYEIINHIAACENFLYKKIQTTIQKNSRGRLADTILYLAEIYNTDELQLSLTRKDIAELAGTSLENSIRIISEFKKEQIIEVDGRYIKILNKNLLKKIQELG